MRPKPLTRICGLLASAITVAVLIGCNGSSGSNGTNGTNGTNGAPGAPGTPGTPGSSAANVLDATILSPAEWIALNPKGTITGVTLSAGHGQPTVDFKIVDPKGRGVVGLETFTKLDPSKDKTASLPNFAFSISKLIPAGVTVGAPSKWINYVVTTVPTVAKPNVAPTRPTSDINGVLVGHGDGTYTYTFARDITGATGVLAAAQVAGKDVSALDDVTFDASKPHRLVMEFYGNARGTGSGSHVNTPDGTPGGPAAEISSPINVVYDFVPATGATIAASAGTREIVSLQTCNTCHTKFNYHGAHRVEPRYCVICHTDQMNYTTTPATRDGLGTTFTGPAGDTSNVNGTSMYKFDQLVHMIHRGESLGMTGNTVSIDPGIPINAVRYPQSQANCDTCHVSGANTPQAGNFATVPNRASCGGCHDTVDFITGINHDAPFNRVEADDSNCAVCHDAAGLALVHAPVCPPDKTNGGLLISQGGVVGNTHTNSSFVAGNQSNLPTGAIPITFNLVSASVSANKPVWTFNFLNMSTTPPTPIVFNAFGAKTEMMDNFAGGPNLYMAYAVPQDGIATPNDFNNSVSVNLRKLWRGGAAAGSTFVANGDGTYTATLAGVTIPNSATMITGGIGYFYGVVAATANGTVAPAVTVAQTDSLPLTQINLAAYPFNTYLSAAAPYQGGLSVVAPNVWKPANASAVNGTRRSIVDEAKCDACHKNLGVFTDHVFHAGQRNDAPTCTFCHTANGVDSGNSYNIKEAVHSLHAAGMRNTPYGWQSQLAYWDVTYPAVLNNCEACHKPGTYDLSANAAQIPNLLWTTTASGSFPVTYQTANTNGGVAVVTAQVLTNANKTIGTYSDGMAVPTTKNNNVVSAFLLPGQVTTSLNAGLFSANIPANYATVTTPAAGANNAFTVGSAVYGNGLTVNTGVAPSTVTTFANLMTGAAKPALAVGAIYEADPQTLVNSPITSACYACHDSDSARAHMVTNGGSLNVLRSSVTTSVAGVNTVGINNKAESCLVCHAAGKVADIVAAHINF